MSINDNDVTFSKFKTYFPIMAEKAVDYYRSGINAIVVLMNDGSRLEYHSTMNTIRSIVSSTEEKAFTEDNYQRDFSYNLMSKMVDAGLTQSSLAEKTGISQVSISRYLNRKALPNIYNCEKIARVLNCSINELTKQMYWVA